MVNIEDFVKRLEIILDYYGINASSFADKIGVQRSSMSHLLSGRNKPSLDFVMKILEVFPDVDLYWLLNGKGEFPKNTEEVLNPKIHSNSESENVVSPLSSNEKLETFDLFSGIENNEVKNEGQNVSSKKKQLYSSQENEIEKIVFFYKNGTFKAFNP